MSWRKFLFGWAAVALFLIELDTALLLTLGPDSSENLDVRVADNISEYFSHLSAKQVDSFSDVDRVIPVQTALKALGYDVGSCGVDGMYGDSVRFAVSDFQQKHGLDCTGDVDTRTYGVLVDELLRNEDAAAQVDAVLLAPYRKDSVRQVVDNLDSITAALPHTPILLRPDVIAYAAYELFANDERVTAAEKAFPGCANFHLRDAFRHSDSVFRIAGYAGNAWAVTIGDIREKSDFKGLPGFLMDVYNHRAAASFRDEHPEAGNSEGQELFLQGIREGKFALYPFPLVPKAGAEITLQSRLG